MVQIVEKIKKYIFNKILQKILIISIIITSIFSYIPIASFAVDEEEIEEVQKYPAIVPAYADAIISKFVSTEISSGDGSYSNGDVDVITDNSETGDGWDSTTTVTYPNGTKRTYRNYKQFQGSYALEKYWGHNLEKIGDGYVGKDDDSGQTIWNSACGPSAASIILSGYGIDANPLKVVNSFFSLGYNQTNMTKIQEVLEKKYNIKSEYKIVSSSSVEDIRNNFKAGRPIIAGVTNHFVAYLGEDSNGNLILSDPGYTDGRNENTLSGYVNSHIGYEVLLITTDDNVTANKSSSSSSSSKKSSTKTTAKTSGNGEAKIEECPVSNGGYTAIFTSGTTGRQFKEFKQNASYNYPTIYNSYWGQECGTVATGIVGSGYKNLTMQDIADELNNNGGGTNFTQFLGDFTGQSVSCSSVSSKDEFANILSNGSVAVIHDYGYSGRGHYLAVLDISKDKSKVYVSNPDVYGTGADGMSEGWNSIDFVYNAIQKGEIYFVTDDGDGINYSSGGTVKKLKEDKIFYIGDSTMVGLNAYGVAKSPSSYFFAEGGRNADWVMSNYSNLKIPSDASCIVIEFGANGLYLGSKNWKNTQELIDKLAEDYSDKEIFVTQVAHICDGYTVDPDFNSKLDEYNEHMKEYCKGKNGVTYINPTTNVVSDNGRGYLKNGYAADPDDTSMGGGKIHFNLDGYKVWYEDLIKCIKENLPAETSNQSIDMSKNIVLRDKEHPEKGYKINIDFDAEIDNFLEQLEKKGYHLENYLSTKNQKQYLRDMIKACIVTQYPDLRSAREIASDAEIPSSEAQGCIKIKRYADDETKTFALGNLTNPIDNNDEDKGRYLSYIPYDEFSDMISDENRRALNYFSMDSSNNIVVAGWETMDVQVNGPYQTDYTNGPAPSTSKISYTPKQTPYSKLTEKKFSYLSQVSNYAMPFSLLWSLLVYGHNEKFVDDLAKLVIDTEIVIGSFDATNVRVTTNTEKYTIREEASPTINTTNESSQTPHAVNRDNIEKVFVEYEFEVVEIDTLKTDTPNLKVIYADTWTAIYKNNYRLKTETENAGEQTVELDDEILKRDWLIKRGDIYVGDRTPENGLLKEKTDEAIDNKKEDVLNKAIREQQQAADAENAKIAYKYQALQSKIDEYYNNTNLGKFLSEKDVQSNVINMIIGNYSRKNIEAVFSVENDLMVKYAKNHSLIPSIILAQATEAVVSKFQTDTDLYNALTKNNTDFTLAKVYTSNIDSIDIETQQVKADQTETINEEITTATVEEVPTNDNVTWKISKSIFAKNSFVKLLTYNAEAKTNLLTVSGWFFESLENTAAIADLEDLMKFLFQCVFDVDYGITEEDIEKLKDLFDPEKMAAFNSKKTSHGNIVGGASYSSLTLSDEDMQILYKLVEAEGGGGSHEQVMYIACTILNRVLSSSFPNTISDVAFAPSQFEVTWNGMYDAAVPSQNTIDAVNDALQTGDTTGGSIGFQNDWLYDSQYPGQTWETPIELLRETWPYGGVVVFFTTASIQAELSQY